MEQTGIERIQIARRCSVTDNVANCRVPLTNVLGTTAAPPGSLYGGDLEPRPA
jgi:hypothetical protein